MDLHVNEHIPYFYRGKNAKKKKTHTHTRFDSLQILVNAIRIAVAVKLRYERTKMKITNIRLMLGEKQQIARVNILLQER